jgi:tetratricopeptide (TPR) repeat protein
MDSVDETGREEPAALQFDLFGQARIKLGDGYASLARLDLDKAASIFGDLIRDNPQFADAADGKTMALEWGDALWGIESLNCEAAALSLWEKIGSSSFGQWGDGLRKALVKRVIELIGANEDFFIPPDLCLGSLHIDVMQYEQAEDSLRKLLEKHPDNARIFCLLGNALLPQRRRSEARGFYAKAFVRSPREAGEAGPNDDELAAIIRREGPYMTPVYGLLEDVLPLVDAAAIVAVDQDHARTLKIYRALSRAEAAREKRDHRKMVEERKVLKELSPEVFEAYITRLT